MNVNNKEQPENLNQKFRESMSKGHSIPIHPQRKETFISNVKRFASSSTVAPGPGSYESLAQEKHTLDFRSVKKKEEDVYTLPKEHAWINGSDRMSFVPSKSALNKLGPGEYTNPMSQSQVRNSSWSKC